MTVALARKATAQPMGQQYAEEHLIDALGRLPMAPSIRTLRLASLRAPLAADRRLPLARLAHLPWPVQRLAGAWAYRGHAWVHRLDLGLPPGRRELLTVHDLAPLRFDDEGTMPSQAARSIRRAAAVICPSRFTADELRATYGVGRVEVIPNGLDPAFLDAQPLPPQEREALGLPDRWILHSGGATKRKNLGLLADAWRAVQAREPDVGLVLCGPADPRRTALFAGQPRTHLLGKVERRTVVGLVAGAAAVVVPSTYEGFGLPAAEAMACGVPVVATALSALPEVTGGFAILVADEAEALADGIASALAGVDRETIASARALARGRTWEAAASAHARLYEQVAR